MCARQSGVEFMASRIWEARVMRGVFMWTPESSKDKVRKDVVGQMDLLCLLPTWDFPGSGAPSPV